MRPTGKLHLGNYMGALANWVKLQDEFECYFFIADWHALTTDYADTSQIVTNTRDVLLDYLAAGLDPEKSVLFLQSKVLQHAELTLLLGMITPLGWLERVPSYKEQQENLSSKDLSSIGFLGYPLLQAADILIYQPQFVPVGHDQAAHVELTREVARRFNQFYPKQGAKDSRGIPKRASDSGGLEALYGLTNPEEPPKGLEALYGLSASEVTSAPENPGALRRAAQLQYVLPEPQVLLTPSPKLPGTDGRKMSKSYGNTILMTDPEPVVRQKLKTMVTDPARVRRTDPGDPDKCPVGDLHKVFSTPETMVNVYEGCRSAGIGCIECKGWAADALVKVLAPIQERRASFTEAQVTEILEDGSNRARARAEQTMQEVRAAMQLIPSATKTL
jgi:tryptophanyl-tRNA synthetase